jgi:two-component system chemotaxis response regulator CheY
MKKILVVDDSKVVRKFIIGCLDKLGFTGIKEAEHGLAAVELVKVEMPDVILLDWNMPVMDGLEFIKTLRTMPNGNSPIVIFCTTENEITKITEALTHTANEYIMKPFDGDVLKTKFVQLGIM